MSALTMRCFSNGGISKIKGQVLISFRSELCWILLMIFISSFPIMRVQFVTCFPLKLTYSQWYCTSFNYFLLGCLWMQHGALTLLSLLSCNLWAFVYQAHEVMMERDCWELCSGLTHYSTYSDGKSTAGLQVNIPVREQSPHVKAGRGREGGGRAERRRLGVK